MFILTLCISITSYSSFVESKLYLQLHTNTSDISTDLHESSFLENEINDVDVALDERFKYNSTHNDFIFWEICQATFVKLYNHVSILTINNDFLDPKSMYNNFGQVEWHTTTTTFKASEAVVLVVESAKDFHELVYTQFLWDQDAIFVIIVLQCATDVKIEMTSLWQFYSIYKYVLICGARYNVLYIFRPYYLNGSKIVKISDLSEIGYNILRGTSNLYGAIMRVVFFPRMPTAVTKNGKYIGGADYNALVTLKERMNFTINMIQPTDGKTFTQAGEKVTGSARDIVIGNADIALNGHFIQDYKIPGMRLTRYIYMDKICFIVGMPSFKSHFAVIIHIFSLGVWIHIVLMYYLITLLYFGIQKICRSQTHGIQELCIQTFALIVTGASKLHVGLTSKKMLIGSALVTALILNNTFQGMLVTVLSKPKRDSYIDSLEDILQSDVALQSQRAESLISDPEIAQLLNTLRKRRLNKKETNFIRVGRFPIMKLVAYRNYLNYKDNRTEFLHTVPECIMSNFLAYVVPEHSPFLRTINKCLKRFQEVGLISKWFSGEMDYLLRDTYWPLDNEHLIQSQAKIFSLADLSFIFSLLITGLLFSTVVFIIEQILGIYVLYKNMAVSSLSFKLIGFKLRRQRELN